MAIVHARIDERLIHGQVAMVWTNVVKATRIMVANDQAVKDEMQINLLKMAKPAGVKLSILSVNKAIENIKANKYEGQNVFLLTKDVADMVRILEGGVDISAVNVGNVSEKEGSIKIKNSVHLTPEEIKGIEGLIEKGITVTAQMVPNESAETIANYIKASKK